MGDEEWCIHFVVPGVNRHSNIKPRWRFLSLNRSSTFSVYEFRTDDVKVNRRISVLRILRYVYVFVLHEIPTIHVF